MEVSARAYAVHALRGIPPCTQCSGKALVRSLTSTQTRMLGSTHTHTRPEHTHTHTYTKQTQVPGRRAAQVPGLLLPGAGD